MDAWRFPANRAVLPALTVLLIAPLLLFPWARAQEEQEGWEMRVCAAPFDYPVTSRENGGFNNRIAEVLATHLGAHVTYEWVRLDLQNVQRTLLSGSCDLIIGIAEGASNVLSTVPYLRVPFVFVSREDADIQIESLNDPILKELRIGTYQFGLPAHVLNGLGISGNVIGYPPVGTPGGSNLDLAALQAVASGEVDVAILYAPRAVAFDENNPVDLRIVPVTPEVIPGETLIVMSRTWTIGVRPGDESFRDRLNIALAERWADVQAAIDEFGIPRLDSPAPIKGEVARQPGTGVGVIVPGRTGGMVDNVVTGESARRGALIAEAFMDSSGGTADSHTLHANAPTVDASVRAAERLIATEEVGALVGGFGHEESARLSEIAEEAGVIFFNVASTATDLRQQCLTNTFFIEASSAMLADAAISWYFDEEGIGSWFLVHEESPGGEALLDHLQRTLEEVGGELAGSAASAPAQFLYFEAIDQAVASGADGVLLALAPADQELFLSQYPQGEGPPVVLVPGTAAQTRDFFRRFADVSPLGAAVRPVTWDASLDSEVSDLNAAYLSRNAAPMDPVSWTTYAAVTIFHQAVIENQDRSAEALVGYLTAPDRSFELGKGVGLSFRPWNHQLRQPIYLVRPDPEAEWNIEPQAQAEFVEIVGRVPVDQETAALDSLGISEEDSRCTAP